MHTLVHTCTTLKVKKGNKLPQTHDKRDFGTALLYIDFEVFSFSGNRQDFMFEGECGSRRRILKFLISLMPEVLIAFLHASKEKLEIVSITNIILLLFGIKIWGLFCWGRIPIVPWWLKRNTHWGEKNTEKCLMRWLSFSIHGGKVQPDTKNFPGDIRKKYLTTDDLLEIFFFFLFFSRLLETTQYTRKFYLPEKEFCFTKKKKMLYRMKIRLEKAHGKKWTKSPINHSARNWSSPCRWGIHNFKSLFYCSIFQQVPQTRGYLLHMLLAT